MGSKVPARRLQIARMSSRELHGIAGRFNRARTSADLSERQEWLYDVAVAELEHRHRSQPRLLARCWCELCCNPFDPEMP